MCVDVCNNHVLIVLIERFLFVRVHNMFYHMICLILVINTTTGAKLGICLYDTAFVRRILLFAFKISYYMSPPLILFCSVGGTSHCVYLICI